MDDYTQPLKKIKLDSMPSTITIKNKMNDEEFDTAENETQYLTFKGKMAQPAATLNMTSSPIFIYLQNTTNSAAKLEPNKYLVASTSKPAMEQKEDSIKKLFSSMQNSILGRLGSIEQKLEGLSSRCHVLEETLEAILLKTTEDLNNKITLAARKRDPGSFFADVPSVSTAGDVRLSSQLRYLNSEDNFPNGSWLGDPNAADLRVRCAISPSDLFSLNDSCPTPEKMALSLLDHLFDRETQACSNISGTGKHGKNQLDPLKIFGIRCHLMYLFDINDQQWQRIKLNLDSKCRTAFRRKRKGMSLTVKGFREKSTFAQENCDDENNCGNSSSFPLELSGLSHQTEDASEINLTENVQNAEHQVQLEIPSIIHTDQGDVHIIHATLEDLNQLKAHHHIEILETSEFSQLTTDDGT